MRGVVTKPRDGYTVKGEEVEVVRMAGACYVVKTSKGYKFISLPNSILLLEGVNT